MDDNQAYGKNQIIQGNNGMLEEWNNEKPEVRGQNLRASEPWSLRGQMT
jgi:hypothetical protein